MGCYSSPPLKLHATGDCCYSLTEEKVFADTDIAPAQGSMPPSLIIFALPCVGYLSTRSPPLELLAADGYCVFLSDEKVLANLDIGPADGRTPPSLMVFVLPHIGSLSSHSPTPELRTTTVSKVTTSVPMTEDSLSSWRTLSPALAVGPSSYVIIFRHDMEQGPTRPGQFPLFLHSLLQMFLIPFHCCLIIE
jgi:hypothetical protein